MAYWWSEDTSQKYWVEIRKQPGTGTGLLCPNADEDGGTDPWYELVSSVKRHEVIYHWHAREHRFVGRSFAATNAVEDPDEQTYRVGLRDFTPIAADVSLEDVRAMADELYEIRDSLQARYGPPLYLPFQFKQDRAQLGFMSNYFAKLPVEMVALVFGTDELAESRLPPLPVSPGNAPPDRDESRIRVGANRRAFLTPFRPKADTNYIVNIERGRRTHTRKHERLVNSCAKWLAELELSPRRNAAVDLGLEAPPVVIEAKIIGSSWASSIREAVGQLYEYRYFKVSDPESELIFLADKPVPTQWIEYLERDRGIGAMWPRDGEFEPSGVAARALAKRRH